MAADRLDDPDYPAYTTGRAAEVLGVQQAFLRSLDAAGAVRPQRTPGGRRRYSRRQLAFAARIRELFDQGHTLAAALRILDLEDGLAAERALTARLQNGSASGTGRTADRGRPVLRPAAAARARLPGPPRGGLLAGELPEPGQLGLELAGFLLQLQDLADAGQVQPVGGQRADLGEPVDVPPGVPAGAARAARRVQEPFPLVDPQRLRVQAGQLRRHRDTEQPPVQVRPPRVYHARPRW